MVSFYPWVIADFYIQFFVAEMLFFIGLKKKPGFAPKLALCFVIYSVIAYFSLCLFMQLNFMWPYFILLLILGVCIGRLLVNVSLQDLIFLALVSYTIQNAAYHADRIIQLSIGYDASQWFSPFVSLAVFCAAYSVTYFALIRRMDKEQILGVPKYYIIALSVIVLSLEYALNIIAFDRGESSILLFIALFACALLTLLLQFNIFSSNRLVKEYEDIRHLLEKEQEQYRQSKENIELINMKCHDIKHQISSLRNIPAEDFIEEAQNAVSIYDNTAQTGNEALDIIITEKSLYCHNNDIHLTYIADGKKLSFMKPTDIYSLFGNALTNAIECVSKESEAEKRIISLNIHQKDKLLFVNIENYTPSEESFDNIIPATEKNRSYHGYGLRSIKFITEKYGGQMNISQKDHYFSLTILFPL